MQAAAKRLSVAVVLSSLWRVDAQHQCYYPDGTLSTTDTPCNGSAGVSACCGSSAYCLSNGLCLESNILHRSSCTDKTWASGSCPQYCTDEDSSTSSPITPCTPTTFTCGLHPASCAASSSTFPISEDAPASIVLRTPQLRSAMTSAGMVNSTTTPATSPPTIFFTSPQIAGTAVGIGLPLLLIIALLTSLLLREQRRNRAINTHNDQALYRSPLSPGVREINTCSWSAWSDPYSTRNTAIAAGGGGGSRRGSEARGSVVPPGPTSGALECIREVEPSWRSRRDSPSDHESARPF